MNQRVSNRLKRHREDYARVTGEPFEHFFCPIMFEDEPVEPVRGHVINDSFKGSSKTCVIQRGDVDRFFGRFFEHDFLLLQYMYCATHMDYFTHPQLSKHARPRVLYDGIAREYFVPRGKARNAPPPPGFQCIFKKGDQRVVKIHVRATSEEANVDPERWETEARKDLRLVTYVSLIKAAHLSLFSVLGYRYALSPAGRYIGQDILGRFYRDNSHLTDKRNVQTRAFAFFKQYQHMVRPIATDAIAMQGTLSDGKITLCPSITDLPWGMMVFIGTGMLRHAVLIPCFKGINSLATYLEFMRNDHEQIHTMIGQYFTDPERWVFNPERTPIHWPKDSSSYPSRFEYR